MIERTARRAAPAAVALYAVLGIVISGRPTTSAVLAAVGVAAVATALAVLHVRGWPLVVGLAVQVAGFAVICWGQPSNLGWFGICVLAAWGTLAEPVPRAVLPGLVGCLAVAGQAVWVTGDSGWGAWAGGTAFTVVACALSRRERLLNERLREAQAGLAEQARMEERGRVAREVHDVIGHALTVSLLHISSARLALADVDAGPEEADRALAEAERLSQQSLAEVRSAVGLVADPAARTPLPGVEDLEELVGSFRRAGTEVSCRVEGDLARLTAAEGLVVYRILQEALTNVARHAAAPRAEVVVDGTDAQVWVRVDSPGAAAPGTEGGTGLAGMRERAAAVGGRVSAGPHGSGWRVEAVLPT